MDLLLRHASLIDGTGEPARPADVAVSGDRIVAVAGPGELSPDEKHAISHRARAFRALTALL